MATRGAGEFHLRSNKLRTGNDKNESTNQEKYPLIEGMYGSNGFYFQVSRSRHALI